MENILGFQRRNKMMYQGDELITSNFCLNINNFSQKISKIANKLHIFEEQIKIKGLKFEELLDNLVGFID